MGQRTTSSSLEWVLEKRPALGRLLYVVQCSTAYDRRSSNTCNQHKGVKLSLPQRKQALPADCSVLGSVLALPGPVCCTRQGVSSDLSRKTTRLM